MLVGLGLLVLAVIWFYGFVLASDSIEDQYPDTSHWLDSAVALGCCWLGFTLIFALCGAFNLIAGCACAEDFIKPIEDQE